MSDLAAFSTPDSVAAPRSVTDQQWGKIVRSGAIGALILVFIALVNMPIKMDTVEIVERYLSLGYLSLVWVPFAIGAIVAKQVVLEGMVANRRGARDLVAGALSGGISGLGISLLIWLLSAIDLRDPLVNWSPALAEQLSFGKDQGLAALIWLGIGAGLGLFGALVSILPHRYRRAVTGVLSIIVLFAILELAITDLFTSNGFIAETLKFETVADKIYAKRGGLTVFGLIGLVMVSLLWSFGVSDRAKKAHVRYKSLEGPSKQKSKIAVFAMTAVAFLVLPMLFGKIMNELLANVGLFVLLALGLNIVVGLAGMLDLGYVAFFAVGGYTTAVLTSPLSPAWAPQLHFGWVILIVVVMAAITGLLIGAPVIRMRGDYLAIVTLGFGEIVRFIFLSDAASGMFGGAQGITNIPPVDLGPWEVTGTDPRSVFYLVLVFCALAIYISWRMQNSRVGRSWMAIREDETVADAMGINTVNSKLLAFVVGAVLASFSGAIFAAKVGSIFPNSFLILVSVIILVVVIVGGIGSIPGVIVGSVVLIGILGGPKQPGLLFELGEFKLLIYGALLVVMMLKRPEGLVPSAVRTRELHQEEFLQDAWLKGEIDHESEETAEVAE